MADFCYPACEFINEGTDEYATTCYSCGRPDPMAGLVLARMEREADALDELATDWEPRFDGGFSRWTFANDTQWVVVKETSIVGYTDGEPVYVTVTKLYQDECCPGEPMTPIGEYEGWAAAVLAARGFDRVRKYEGTDEENPPF